MGEHKGSNPLSSVSGSNRDAFARRVLERRQELGLSLRQLEARTGIHVSRLSRWEQGKDMPSHPDRLTALAKGLDLPPADLYVLAGMELAAELPSMRPYLRSKYRDLPPAAIKQIEAIAADYGVATGPAPGEDE